MNSIRPASSAAGTRSNIPASATGFLRHSEAAKSPQTANASSFQASSSYIPPLSSSRSAPTSLGPAYPGLEALCERYLPAHASNVDEIYWLASWIIQNDKRFAPGLVELPPRGDAPDAERQEELQQNVKLCAKLTQDLVGLIKRPVNEVVVGGTSFTQRCGHIAAGPLGVDTLINDLTLSSVAIKKDHKPGNEFMQRFNASLARIEAGALAVCGRSARSDTPQKLEELLKFNALSALEAAQGDLSQATGFHLDEASGEYRFQMTLITAMDRSTLKGWFSSLTGGERERTFIANIENSVEDLFGDSPQLRRVLSLGGAPVKVCFERPALLNLTLSGQSRLEANITRHRTCNRPTLDRLVGQLCATWGQNEGAEKILSRILKEGLERGTLSSENFWSQAPVETARRRVGDREALVVNLIQHIYTGRTYGGNELLDKSDPSVEFVLLSYLLKETNQALTVQCKSGQDRTLTLVGLQVAATAFEKERGYAFNPLLPSDDPDVARFRALFTDAVNTFGEPMIKTVRGYNAHHGIAKWASHPSPLRWYNPEQDPRHPIGRF